MELKNYKIEERLDLIPKDQISYRYIMTEIEDLGNGIENVSNAYIETNNIEDLNKDYTFDDFPTEDRDFYKTHKFIDGYFAIDLYKFDREIKKDIYEKEFDKNGNLIKLYNEKSGHYQLNTFDRKGNLIHSLYLNKNKNIQCVKNYVYDDRGKCIKETKFNYPYNTRIFSRTGIDIEKTISYNEKEKTSKTLIHGYKYKIITQWDIDFKKPLFKIVELNDGTIIEIVEYYYKEDNITIIKTKAMNVAYNNLRG